MLSIMVVKRRQGLNSSAEASGFGPEGHMYLVFVSYTSSNILIVLGRMNVMNNIKMFSKNHKMSHYR